MGHKYRVWKETDRRRRGFTGPMSRIMRKALKKSVDFSLPTERWEEAVDQGPVKEAFKRIYLIVGLSFATLAFERLSKQRKQQEAWRTEIDRFAELETARRITGVTETTKKLIRERIRIGIAEGLDIEKIGRNIRADWPEITRKRGLRIARTEVISASNHGAVVGAKSLERETGLSVLKNWLSSRDSRVRTGVYDHLLAEQENQGVPIDSVFNVSGEMLRFPGDPGGSPGNVINCRCAVTFDTK